MNPLLAISGTRYPAKSLTPPFSFANCLEEERLKRDGKCPGLSLIRSKMTMNHRQDCGLARTGGEDRKNINAIKQPPYSLDLMILWRVWSEVLKHFPYEFLSRVRE